MDNRWGTPDPTPVPGKPCPACGRSGVLIDSESDDQLGAVIEHWHCGRTPQCRDYLEWDRPIQRTA